MMKKVIISIGSAVVGAMIIMPYIMGYVAQDSIKKLTLQMNEQEVLYGRLETTAYQRGYFESRASYSWELPAPYAQEFGVIEYSCEAKHGLFFYDYQCHIDKLDSYKAFVAEYLSGHDPLHIDGHISVFGGVASRLVLDGFVFSKDNVSIDVKPAYLNVESDLSLLPYVATAEFGGVTLVNRTDESAVTVGRTVVNADTVIKYDNLMLGHSDIVVDVISVKGPTRSSDIHKLALMFDTQEADADHLSADYIINVDSIVSTDRLTGDVLGVKNSNMSLMIDGLDKEPFLLLLEGLNEISQLNNGYGQVTAEQQQAMMLTLLPSVEALLQEELQVKWGVTAEFDKQPSHLEVNMRLIDQVNLSEVSSWLFNHDALLDKLEMNIDGVVPESALAEMGAVQALAVSHPAVQKIGAAYESHIQLKKGAVMLNGDSLSLHDLIVRLSGR